MLVRVGVPLYNPLKTRNGTLFVPRPLLGPVYINIYYMYIYIYVYICMLYIYIYTF